MTVSIITPVYNAQASLPACLDALRSQTYADLQIVLVDDGSTDGSAQLCDDAAAADARVIAVHQLNAGPSAARNAGLDAATGDWIMFVDSDDYIEPDYVQTMLQAAQENDVKLVASDCLLCEGDAQRRFGMLVPSMLYPDRAELWQDFMADRIPWSLWAKLYRADLFKGVRFNQGDYIAEDLDVNARIFAREDISLVTIDSTGYHYTVAEGSVDHTFTERHLCQFEIFERVVDLAHELDLKTLTSPEVFYEERMLNCLRKALAADALTPEITAAFKEAIALHRTDVLRDKNASSGLRLRMFATYLGPRAYGVFNRLYR